MLYTDRKPEQQAEMGQETAMQEAYWRETIMR
jgi:hypothetical protein